METKRNFKQGVQRNRINLTLSNSEVDTLYFAFENDNSEMANHIKVVIEKARRVK